MGVSQEVIQYAAKALCSPVAMLVADGRLSRKLDAANAALRASEGEKERMGKAVMHLVHKGLLIQRLKVLSSSDFCS